jgi:hypothetical protein
MKALEWCSTAPADPLVRNKRGALPNAIFSGIAGRIGCHHDDFHFSRRCFTSPSSDSPSTGPILISIIAKSEDAFFNELQRHLQRSNAELVTTLGQNQSKRFTKFCSSSTTNTDLTTGFTVLTVQSCP